MTVENLVRIVWRVLRKLKKVEKLLFFDRFGLILANVSHIAAIKFDEIIHKGP